MALVASTDSQHVSDLLHCTACMTCFSPFQSLEDHYWESDDHPKCRPCILGFENQEAWAAVCLHFYLSRMHGALT